MKITFRQISAVAKLIVAFGFNHIEIQASINFCNTGHRSDQYALLQRQASLAAKPH